MLPCIHHGGTDAMERYYELETNRHRTPFVIVRGMSDWLHSPLVRAGKDIWLQGPVVENFAEGYKYAIVTASSAVLSTLQLRCVRGATSPPPAGTCTYNISYS
jgi:hypothetical protein